MDLDHNKAKIDWFYLKKIVLGIVLGDQFLYIFLEFGYKHSFCFYSVYLYTPRVDQIAGVDPCPISTFPKSLESSYKAENYCLGITSSLMWPQSQLQSIQYGGSSFLLDIIWLSFVLCFQDACPYQ